MSAAYGIWFAVGDGEVAGLSDRLASELALEFVDHGAPDTVTAVGDGLSWDLVVGLDAEDDRDLPLSRYPVVLELRPWRPTPQDTQLQTVRALFDRVRGWGVPALLVWDAQRLVDRIDGPDGSPEVRAGP